MFGFATIEAAEWSLGRSHSDNSVPLKTCTLARSDNVGNAVGVDVGVGHRGPVGEGSVDAAPHVQRDGRCRRPGPRPWGLQQSSLLCG